MSWMLEAGGQLASAEGYPQQAKMQKAAAYDEAEQMEEQAVSEVAVASFNSERIRKKSEQILSSIRAGAAAGGGSSDDASVIAIEKESVANASMDQLLEMVGGQEKARMLRRDAKQTRYSGDIDAYGSKMRAFGARLGAATTVVEAGESAGWFGGGG